MVYHGPGVKKGSAAMADGARAARLAEAEHILAFGRSSDSPYMVHLQSPFSVANYIRIADEVARLSRRTQRTAGSEAPPAILDWGAGFGQLSYLLAARGCAVTSYDLGAPGTYPLPIEPARTILRDAHPSRLPFADCTFDVVVSCGVLEHVEDDGASLDEIHRILRPGGLFPIYNLPQRWGCVELLVKALRLGYTHERRYSASGARRLLAAHGFKVRWMRRSNLLPHTFRGLPPSIRSALTANASTLLALDLALGRIPLLNQVAGILEMLAVRSG
jgi:SAM-dependent methyltransferase